MKKAGYDRKLPEGVVIVGGGARLRDLADFARTKLELAAKIGKPLMTGINDAVDGPEYATAIGLMLFGIDILPDEDLGKSHIGLFARIKKLFISK